jgi:hypothetical protein
MNIDFSDIPQSSMTDEEWEALLADPCWVHYAAIISPPRPGVWECLTLLEYDHFPPGTPMNQEYILAVCEWDETAWAIVSIPLEKKQNMEDLARYCRLQLLRCIPYIIDSTVRHPFRNQNMEMYLLENMTVSSDSREAQAVYRALHRQMEETIARHHGRSGSSLN